MKKMQIDAKNFSVLGGGGGGLLGRVGLPLTHNYYYFGPQGNESNE